MNRRKLVRALREQGYTVEPTGGGHLRVLDRRGAVVGVAAATPSDWRSDRNLLARLRQTGFVWPWSQDRRRAQRPL